MKKIIFLLATLMIALLLSSCSTESTTATDDHDHDMLQVTIWTHGKEIFIEHASPVAGKPADFILHFTSQKTGKPLSPENSILIAESEGATPVRHAITNKEAEGIFHELVTLPSAGHWSISLEENGHSHYLFHLDAFATEAEAEEAAHEHDHEGEATDDAEHDHDHEAEAHDHGDDADHQGETHDHGDGEGEHSHEAEAHGHDDDADHDHAEEAHTDDADLHRHSDHAPEGVSLLKEQQWKIGVVTSIAERMTLVKRLNLPAKVTAPPGSRVKVLPPAAGRIFPPANRPYPAVGEKVVKGQMLAMLQAPVSGADVFQLENLKAELAIKLAEAEAEEIKAKASLRQASQAHERITKLFAKNAKSKRELEESQTALEAAQAQLEAASSSQKAYRESMSSLNMNRQQLGSLKGYPKVPITAPISGILSEVTPAVGEHVLPEQSLFTVIEPSRVYIEGRLNEKELLKIKRNPDATFQMPDSPRDYPQIIAGGLGKLLSIGLEVDQQTRTVPITYELENPGKVLKIGMMLTLSVEAKTSENCVAIPEAAIVDMQGMPTAFVQLSGEVFEKRDLKLGIRDRGYVQILEGIKPGDRIVTQNAYTVRLATANTSEIGHGHVH